MKIRVNTEDVLADILKYRKEVERKLKAAMTTYVYQAVLIATQKTPLGDAERWMELYQYRNTKYGLKEEEGFARGSWQVNESGQFSQKEIYGLSSGEIAAQDAEEYMLNNYKIGDTVYIGNTGPYIMQLENNYSYQTSGEGIVKPTLDEVMAMYNTNFKYIFDRA